MTSTDTTTAATDKLIGALMYQNNLLEKLNATETLSGETKAEILSCMAKASSTTTWEISDREKKLLDKLIPKTVEA